MFCEILDGRRPGHFVWREENLAAFLDIRPLFVGHTLVVPTAHHPSFPDTPVPLVAELFSLAHELASVFRGVLGSEGCFVALNDTVSQSVPHVHVHVVPRRRGDGLRGFFWPRTSYRDEQHAAETARALSEGLVRLRSQGG